MDWAPQLEFSTRAPWPARAGWDLADTGSPVSSHGSRAQLAALQYNLAGAPAYVPGARPHLTPALAAAMELARRDVAAGLVVARRSTPSPEPTEGSAAGAVPPAGSPARSPHRPVRHRLRDCHVETAPEELTGGHAHHHGPAATAVHPPPAALAPTAPVRRPTTAKPGAKMRAAMQQIHTLQRDIHAKVRRNEGRQNGGTDWDEP